MGRLLIGAIWLAWAIYWLIPRAKAKPVQRRETVWSRLLVWGPAVIGGFLLFDRRILTGWWQEFFIPRPWHGPLFWAGLVLLVVGLAFTIWARVHLGGNWSGWVTLKEGHELVDTGPYAWVRHPIYTGAILALLGTAFADGRWRSAVGFLLIAAGLLYKLRVEERWLGELFPAAYPDYRKHVRALIPGIY